MIPSQNTVLITGGSSGIGLALAKRFWQEKNNVIILGRDPTKLAKAQAALSGCKVEAINMRDIEAMSHLPSRHPNVNVLINNAGVQYNYDFADPMMPLEHIEQEIGTNLLGPMILTKLFLPQLQAKKEAAIVNVSSALGFVPKQNAAVYCASKSAVHMFSKTLRWQLEQTNIRLFELIPALVDTPMTQGRDQDKISPEALVDEFWRGFCNNRDEIRIGKVKQLLLLNRLMPKLAEKMMRGA